MCTILALPLGPPSLIKFHLIDKNGKYQAVKVSSSGSLGIRVQGQGVQGCQRSNGTRVQEHGSTNVQGCEDLSGRQGARVEDDSRPVFAPSHQSAKSSFTQCVMLSCPHNIWKGMKECKRVRGHRALESSWAQHARQIKNYVLVPII